MSTVIDLIELLNLEGLNELSYQERMKIFQNKAKTLGFDTKEIDAASTKSINTHITTLNFKENKREETAIGVYFFYLYKGTIEKEKWDNFKYSIQKVSPWNTDGTAMKNDILYIGQRHENLVSRLKDHTVRSNEQTQSLKLYKEECPSFEYNIILFYQIASKKQKMQNKILCLILEAIAKNLFPTKIGK